MRLGLRPARPIGFLFMAAWASVLCFEVAMELIAVRTQLVAYPSVIHDLSLWAGARYQLPVYEMVAGRWSSPFRAGCVIATVGKRPHHGAGASPQGERLRSSVWSTSPRSGRADRDEIATDGADSQMTPDRRDGG
jgi:hypothetical protein